MNHWSEVETLLLQATANLLQETLPQIGGAQWWQHHVLMQLAPSQSIVARELESGDIRALDLAALLRVTDRNWSELAFRLGFDRRGQAHLHHLQGARNRHAHRPVDGLPAIEFSQRH